MIAKDNLIITSELKNQVHKAILFLVDKNDGLKLSQKDVANKLDISESIISDIKANRKELSKLVIYDVISILINFYNINPDFIFKGKGNIIRNSELSTLNEESATYLTGPEKDKLIEDLKKEIKHLQYINKLQTITIESLNKNITLLERKNI